DIGVPPRWLTPRLFEVGSVGLVQFASPASAHDRRFEFEAARPDSERCMREFECDEIQPLAPPISSRFSILLVLGLGLSLGSTLAVFLYWHRRRLWRGALDAPES